VAFPFAGAYAASKYALEAVSDSLRRELRPWNIKVCLIEPGNIQTAIWDKSSRTSREIAADMPEEAKTYYAKWFLGLRSKRAFANDPTAVAAAVIHALTARRPKTRYVIGRDARTYAWLDRLLPDRLLDRAL
jgi:NAD(P)-dependent dehydrogenase (short-subunit alcohol dehydrogenase family)